MGCEVEIIDPDARMGADIAWIRDAATRAARALGVTGGEARVRLVGDAEMARAHLRYSNIPGTTDVLTFDMRENDTARSLTTLDVDVLICVDEASRQAAATADSRDGAHALRNEVLLYTVHAMLHCLGYDDHDEADAARMHAREDEVLSAIGVGPVYAHGGGGAA